MNELLISKSSKRIIDLIILVIGIFFVIHFLSDFINKINLRYHMGWPQFNRIIKGIFLGFSILISGYFLILKKGQNKYLRFILYPIFFSFFFIKIIFIGEFETFVRYLFFLWIIPVYYVIFKHSQFNKNYDTIIYNIFTFITIINFLGVIFGFLFQIEIFATYRGRYGYDGLIMNQMQAPYFYLASLFVFYKKQNTILLILTFISIFLSGIKAIYLGAYLYLLLQIIYFGKLKMNYSKRLLIIIAVNVIFIFILYSILATNLFNKIISEHGLITAITSFRNHNYYDIVEQINSENFSFFFGSINLESFRSEFGFLDIFFFFGIMGLLFYALLLKELFILFATDRTSIAYFIINFSLVALAGNFFYFPFNCFIFITTLLFLNNSYVRQV